MVILYGNKYGIWFIYIVLLVFHMLLYLCQCIFVLYLGESILSFLDVHHSISLLSIVHVSTLPTPHEPLKNAPLQPLKWLQVADMTKHSRTSHYGFLHNPQELGVRICVCIIPISEPINHHWTIIYQLQIFPYS